MTFFITTLLLYGVPFTLGTLFFQWLMNYYNRGKQGKKISSFLVFIFVPTLILVNLYNWEYRKNSFEYFIPNNLKIEITAIENEYFIDQEVTFEITLRDTQSNQFSFSKMIISGNCINVLNSENHPNTLLIEDCNHANDFKFISLKNQEEFEIIETTSFEYRE